MEHEVRERQQEEKHLQECREIIRQNIQIYREKAALSKKESEELFAQVRGGDKELYSQLMVSMNVQEHNEHRLFQNESALQKPYFGRVDYCELADGKEEQLYIGKHGIFQDRTTIVVIDWRAPVSTLYYENELGRGRYAVPEQKQIDVDLRLKRTYDIEEGNLAGYYDCDVAANDELLVKYLAKNKDVVLGDIIATIQKEQNEIIRERPFTDIVVQGVAGSGKTTVAMHRISYILYNYEERFRPEEFCIIGSNDMLLNYITSGLPELDVYHISQKRMDHVFRDILDKDWKKKYSLTEAKPETAWKSRIAFAGALERYLGNIREQMILAGPVTDDRIGVILSKESIARVCVENPHASVDKIAEMLNERVKGRLRLLIPPENRRLYQTAIKKYSKYFTGTGGKKKPSQIYVEFLMDYARQAGDKVLDVLAEVQKGRFDVYDTAAMALIKVRVTEREVHEEYSQIIIDEAQDFGELVYYVLKQILFKCYFTIMGDVSQNIHYEMGMNSWDVLREDVLDQEREKFYVLSKSYRNTIEISGYAGKVLTKASCGAYKIEPVIRHGREVEFHKYPEWGDVCLKSAAGLLREIQGRGYDTVTVICRDKAEADEVRGALEKYIQTGSTEHMKYSGGIMVLPIEYTKGLEFDAVVLWNPDPEHYGENEGDAKLLYVAVTRALHELHVIYQNKLTPLLV